MIFMKNICVCYRSLRDSSTSKKVLIFYSIISFEVTVLNNPMIARVVTTNIGNHPYGSFLKNIVCSI